MLHLEINHKNDKNRFSETILKKRRNHKNSLPAVFLETKYILTFTLADYTSGKTYESFHFAHFKTEVRIPDDWKLKEDFCVNLFPFQSVTSLGLPSAPC